MSSCCRIGCSSCHLHCKSMLLLVPKAPRESGVQGQGRGGRGARWRRGRGAHGGSLPPGSRRGEGAHPALSRAAEAYEAITAPGLAGRTPALADEKFAISPLSKLGFTRMPSYI